MRRENANMVTPTIRRVMDPDLDHLRLTAEIGNGPHPETRKAKEKAKVEKERKVNLRGTRKALHATSTSEPDAPKEMTVNLAMMRKNSRSSRRKVAERIFSRAGPEPRGHYRRRYACHPQ